MGGAAPADPSYGSRATIVSADRIWISYKLNTRWVGEDSNPLDSAWQWHDLRCDGQCEVCHGADACGMVGGKCNGCNGCLPGAGPLTAQTYPG